MVLANACAGADVSMCDIARQVARNDPVPSHSNHREARVRKMVDRHVHFVARVVRNSGTPKAEIDGDVQRAFLAATRRLDDVRPGAEGRFLAQIAFCVAGHARRRWNHERTAASA